MKKKQISLSKIEKKQAPPSLSEEIVKQALSERDLLDDHGPVIIGSRLNKPKF